MMRTVRIATISTKKAMTTSTMSAAIWGVLLLAHERRGAPDLDDLDRRAGFDDAVVVVGACGPHLAIDSHAADALVVRDPLEHDRAAPDQRRRAGAQLRRRSHVRSRDRTHDPQRQHRDDDERGP